MGGNSKLCINDRYSYGLVKELIMNLEAEHIYIMEIPFLDLINSKIGFNAITNEYYLVPNDADSLEDLLYIGKIEYHWDEIVRNARIYDERIF